MNDKWNDGIKWNPRITVDTRATHRHTRTLVFWFGAYCAVLYTALSIAFGGNAPNLHDVLTFVANVTK